MNLRNVHILKSLKQELDQEKAYLKYKKTLLCLQPNIIELIVKFWPQVVSFRRSLFTICINSLFERVCL